MRSSVAKGSRVTFRSSDAADAPIQLGTATDDYGSYVVVAIDGKEGKEGTWIPRERILDVILPPPGTSRPRVKNVGGVGNRGQFVGTRMEKMCVCGKTYGEHLAAKPHPCEETGCPKFRAVRKKKT